MTTTIVGDPSNHIELAHAINDSAGTVQRMRRAIDPRTLRSDSMAHAR